MKTRGSRPVRSHCEYTASPDSTGLRQFPDTRPSYHGTGLFPFIEKHTATHGKLDYVEATRELGTDPSTVAAVDELIRSTVRGLTSLFLVEQPVEYLGRLRQHFPLSGVDYIPDYFAQPFQSFVEKTGDAKVLAHHVNAPTPFRTCGC